MWLNSDSESVLHNHFNTSPRWEAPWLFPEQSFSFLTSVRVLVNSCDLVPSVHGGLISTCQPLAWDLEEENRMNARHAFSPPEHCHTPSISIPWHIALRSVHQEQSMHGSEDRNNLGMPKQSLFSCRLLHICQYESKIYVPSTPFWWMTVKERNYVMQNFAFNIASASLVVFEFGLIPHFLLFSSLIFSFILKCIRLWK